MISELHEIGGDNADAAFATFSRAMREDPRNETTHAQLDRLARGLDKWPEVVGALRSGRERSAARTTSRSRCCSAAPRSRSTSSRDDEGAVETYERVLKASPSTVEAATAIQTIHERTGDWPKLVDILKRKSEMLPNVEERKQLLYRAAQIEEEVLGNADAAIATFRQVLSIDDVDMTAMDALERLYVRLARWEPLKDVYAKKADLAEDPDDKKRDALRARAGLRPRARRRRARRSRPTRASSISTPTSCRRSSRSTGSTAQAERWYDLLGNLERQVELAETTGETVALKYRIGNLWQIRLGDVARAIESYREALEMDPQHAETLHALDGLVHGKVEPVMAARVLEPIYETAGEYAKLVDVLEVMVAHNEDPLARVELLHRIAQLHEQMIGNAHAAFDAYARALRDDSGNQLTLGHIERLAEITGTWEPLAKLYRRRGRASRSTCRARSTCYSRLARVYEQELGDVAQGDRDAIARSSRSSSTTSRRCSRSIGCTRRRPRGPSSPRSCAARSSSPRATHEIAALQFRLGQTLENAARRPQGRRRGLPRDPHGPSDARARRSPRSRTCSTRATSRSRSAASSSRSTRRPASSASCTASTRSSSTKLAGPDRQAMYQRLAELAETRLYDQSKALDWWCEALVEDPRWERALEESERLAGETGAWNDMVDGVHARARDARSDKDVAAARRCSGSRASTSSSSHDAAHAVETHLRVLEIEAEGRRRARRARSPLPQRGDVRRPRRDPAPPHRGRRRIRTSSSSCTSVAARSSADALGDLEQALKLLHGGPRAGEPQPSRPRGDREHPLPPRGLEAAVRDLREADRRRRRRQRDGRHLRAHGADLLATRSTSEDKAIELLGRVLDIRGEEPQALQALADLTTRQRASGKSSSRSSSARSRSRRPTASRSALQAPRPRLGGEARPRAQRARCAGSPPTGIDGNDLETLRSLARALPLDPGVGRAVADDPPDHRRRSARAARSTRTRRSSCTHSSVSSRATCSAASTRRSMRGAA